MTDRRKQPRPDSPDRRSFPRPPLWLNLAILLLAVSIGAFAAAHRNRLEVRFNDSVTSGSNTPQEIQNLRAELAEMDLTGEALRNELEGRLAYVESLRSDEFYISIDTKERKFLFQYGDTVVRDAELTIGEPRVVEGPNATWTFAPLRGSFHVAAKYQSPKWRVPEWLYVMNGEPIPDTRPVVPNGIGRFVIELPNDYIIHSPPDPASPLKEAKPASFMIPEEDLRAIWPRIREGMPVYVF